MRESNLIKKLLLECPANRRLFRNSVGVAYLPDGSVLRYGLCTGSADLIGWETIEITPEMVGRKIAVFAAVEVKTGRVPVSKEQKNFLRAVEASGGIAEIVRE